MRILHLNEKFGPYGGTEQYLNQVMPAQVGQGHTVGVFYEEKTDSDFSLPEVAEYAHRSLKNILNDFSPDLVNLHNCRNMSLIEELLEAVPLLWFCHDHYFTCLQSPPSRYFNFLNRPDNFPPDWRCAFLSAFDGRVPRNPLEIYRRIKNKGWELSIMKKIPQVMVISDYMKRNLLQVGFKEEQVRVVPRQVSSLPAEVAPAPRRGNLLFVGRVEKEKGLRVLLESLKYLTSIPYHLRVGGSGSDLAYCRSLVEEKMLRGDVEFLGYQKGWALGVLYQQADVVVFPSIWPEPFGVVGIEAMAYGRPVVGFDVGGVSQWLKNGHNGLVARYNDSQDLAEKIKVLLKDSDYAERLGQNGRRMVEEKYTLEKHLEVLDKIYENCY